MIWGFVDYENTGSLEGFSVTEYERIFVFCGPKNNRIKLGELPSTEFCRIELIGIKTIGANNLDFHLAFYLGRLHESATREVEFHIISNDTGFNGLVNHLKKIGRRCKHISTKNGSDSAATSIELSKCAALVASRLKQMDGRKRPRKKASLLNWIKSQCNHMKPEVVSERIYEELKLTGNIIASTSGITYHLKR
jgi:hypothetical protein